MTYCTLSNLVDAAGQDTVDRLSIRPGDEDGSRAVGRALSYADGIINGQLSVRFALPLCTIPSILTDIAVDLALDRLADGPLTSTETIRDRAKRARQDLKDIAEGKLNLGLPAKGPEDSPQPVIATTQSGAGILPPTGTKLFDRERLRGM